MRRLRRLSAPCYKRHRLPRATALPMRCRLLILCPTRCQRSRPFRCSLHPASPSNLLQFSRHLPLQPLPTRSSHPHSPIRATRHLRPSLHTSSHNHLRMSLSTSAHQHLFLISLRCLCEPARSFWAIPLPCTTTVPCFSHHPNHSCPAVVVVNASINMTRTPSPR